MSPTEIQALTDALGHAPDEFEQALFLRLKQYLKREPNATEMRNMSTDSNLVLWVITGQ